MDVFFADDSVQLSRRGGAGYVMSFGGVLVKESELRPLSAHMDAIADHYGIPAGEEIKWSPPRGSHIHTNLHSPEREHCYRDILHSATEHDVKAIVICIHFPDRTNCAWAMDDCVMYLFERLCMQLNGRESSGIIVCDQPGGGRSEVSG